MNQRIWNLCNLLGPANGAIRLRVVFLALIVGTNLTAQTSVVTYHNDSQRTGWNPNESTLTPSNVAPNTFGWLATVPLDDQVDTQPLVVPNVSIPGMGVHTVVYVTTEGNTVYAIDGDTGALLKSRNLGPPIAFRRDGKDVKDPLSCFNNGPNVGIDGTGTIDLGSNTLYLLAFTSHSGVPAYDFHALDITTLADRTGSPVTVSATQNGGAIVFTPAVQRQRAGLLEANGRIYAGFSSFCDYAADRARGWLLSWNKNSLAAFPTPELMNRLSSTNSTDCTWPGDHPCFLSAIWMSGFGVAADTSGNVYFTTGNSAPGSYNSGTNLAQSAVKLAPDLSSVLTFFTPSNETGMDDHDVDFGSGGLLVLPDQGGSFPHIAVGSGKDGRFWILNRDNMTGQQSPDIPNNVQIGECWCSPSYYANAAGAAVVTSGGNENNGQIRQVKTWSLTTSGGQPSLSAVASAPAIVGTDKDQDGGFFTSISSNGTAPNTAIIWAVGRASSAADNHVTLYAYNGTPQNGTLPLLWSGTAGFWPNTGGNSNIVPTVANGHVFVASNQQLQIFGTHCPNCPPPPMCSASTDCTGELSISCVGPDVGVEFPGGNCRDTNGEHAPCFAGFTGASTVSAGGNVEWIGSTTAPNVAEACTVNSAGDTCISVTAAVPTGCTAPPTPPVPQCGLGEKWCFKFTPPRCAPINECLITPPRPFAQPKVH